jgi:hypothetical protein
MSQVEIRITAEPVDNHRCKFVVSQPLHAAGVRRFASADEAKGSTLAEAIFAFPRRRHQVIVSGNVSPSSGQSRTLAGRRSGGRCAIRSAVAGGQAVAPAAGRRRAHSSAVNDDTLHEQVAKVFDEQVNPMVARHGGRVG